MGRLYDMHCHLDFAENYEEVARAASDEIACIDATVVPSSFVGAKARLDGYPDLRVGLGIHPWWVANEHIGEIDLNRFETLLPQARIVAEIGLDYHNGYKEKRLLQLEVLERILSAINANGGNRLIFIHAIKSYDDIFHMFEDMGILDNNACVFHWFAGSHEDFGRALSDGFMFSVNMRMMASGQGSLYTKEIPNDRLLLETDSPAHEGSIWSADVWKAEIHNTARAIGEVRGCSENEILELTAANGERLLHLFDAIESYT